MPAKKQPRRGENLGRPCIWPSEGYRGGREIIPDLARAKMEAEHAANYLDQRRYVIRFAGGYVIMGYSDLWDYFGDPMEDETAYVVEAPGRDRYKKWPGEH